MSGGLAAAAALLKGEMLGRGGGDEGGLKIVERDSNSGMVTGTEYKVCACLWI
jgi:hypothetical protein